MPTRLFRRLIAASWLPRLRKQPARFHPSRSRLYVEAFEDRRLLANWTFEGPAPQTDPALLQSANPLFSEGLNQNYAGRTAALAVSPNYDGQGHAALFAGSASGGVWRSDLTRKTNGTRENKGDADI